MDGYYSVHLSVVDAAKLAGITRAQLDYWVKVRLIEPTITAPRGKAGTVKLFNFNNLLKLKILKAFIDAGVSVQALKKLTESDYDQEGIYSITRAEGEQPVKINLSAIIEEFEKGKIDVLPVHSQAGWQMVNLEAINKQLEIDIEEHGYFIKYKGGEWESHKQGKLFPEEVKK